jgi:hypothetical protein
MDKAEKKLLAYFARLPAAERETLVAFAEFLAARAGADQPVGAPEAIPRPDNESVISAVKRLSATYPMLDKAKVLHETSHLVTQHLMQGRAAVEVIDELEIVFRRHYEKLAAE